MEKRLNNLMDKWLDGEIPDEKYHVKKDDLDSRLAEIIMQLSEMEEPEPEEELPSEEILAKQLEEIKEELDGYKEFSVNGIAKGELVEKFVTRIVPMESGTVMWFLNFGGNAPDADSFCEGDYFMVDNFVITYDEANKFRHNFGSYIRENQWTDIPVEVYILS